MYFVDLSTKYREGSIFMKRPNIALMASRDSNKNICVAEHYLNAVWNSGGVGSVLPYTASIEKAESICKCFDGFLFCGGGDISPSVYGGAGEDTSEVCRARDTFEAMIFSEALKTGKPILGICRGAQAINVFSGGDLRPHIVGHIQSTPRFQHDAPAKLVRGSLLHRIIAAESIYVNTFHHQAIGRLGDGLICDAIAEDGIIEAFHHKEMEFCLGVQWHPEAYYDISESSSKIFDAFIAACR
jgi:putative glutamine amidotransferase